MAERYATQTGLWTAATFGGSLPQVGDTVHANGYTVTIDQDVTVAALTTRTGAVAVAGGLFSLSSGVTLTADLICGTSTCVAFGGGSGVLATIVGNLYGSNTTGSVYAVNCSTAGTLTITGTPVGGTVTSSICVNITGTGHVVVYGNPTGGTAAGGSNHGIRYSGSGTLRVHGNAIGAPTGGSTNTAGISNGSSAGTIYLHGNALADLGPGVASNVAGHVHVYGDSVGGVPYTTGGVWLTGSSTGNIYVYGTARSSAIGLGPGAANGGTGSGCILVQAAEVGAGGAWPITGKVLFHDLQNVAFGVRNTAGALRTVGVRPHSPFSAPKTFGVI